MNTPLLSSLALIALLASSGCKRQPTTTVDTMPPPPVAHTQTFEPPSLRKEIDTFEEKPSRLQLARVEKAFAEIDSEIAELVGQVATRSGEDRAEAAGKLSDLRVYREAEQIRFLSLKAGTRFQQQIGETQAMLPEPGPEGVAGKPGEKLEDAARDVEESIKNTAETIRDKVH